VVKEGKPISGVKITDISKVPCMFCEAHVPEAYSCCHPENEDHNMYSQSCSVLDWEICPLRKKNWKEREIRG